MTLRARVLAACVTAVTITTLLACSWTRSPSAADTVFVSKRITTLDPELPTATAVAVRDGWIVGVGDLDDLGRVIDRRTDVVDLGGAAIYPGFTDSHMHLSGVGQQTIELDLRDVESLAELLQRVREVAQQKEAGDWILGRGWIESKWDPPAFPTASDLDSVAPEHPVWLQRIDGHAGVANTLAMRIAKIDAGETPTLDPPGGEIIRDASGAPTGMILDAAMPLVERNVPRRSKSYLRRCLIEGAKVFAARGWTQVQIAGTTASERELIEELVRSGEIPIRVVHATYGPGLEATAAIEAGPVGIERGARFTSRTIKVSYDGALGSGGAAMLEPYSDPNIEGRGLLNDHYDRDFFAMCRSALQRGFQVEVHAIGDRANRHVLDLYERAFLSVPEAERAVADPRFRIEHAQILAPADLPRFAELGVIASMQPSHAITDLHFAPTRIGDERLEFAYAWKAILDSGARVCFGTDAPVEIGDPRIELQAATTRRDLDGVQGENWHAEHAIDLRTALELFTTHAAHAAFQEEWRGRIAVGMAADFTIFDAPLESVPPSEITRRRVIRTVVSGETIFKDGVEAPTLRRSKREI